jgi:hypothetical protein
MGGDGDRLGQGLPSRRDGGQGVVILLVKQIYQLQRRQLI